MTGAVVYATMSSMSKHFDTDPEQGYPTTRAEVRSLDRNELQVFMSECSVEPADFANCLACYAFGVACGWSDFELDLVADNQAKDDELVPHRIIVTEEQFDAIMALLNEPPKSDPKLVELFARPSVFDL